MGRVCVKDHRPEHSLGNDQWVNGCAQCEIESLRSDAERFRWLAARHDGAAGGVFISARDDNENHMNLSDAIDLAMKASK